MVKIWRNKIILFKRSRTYSIQASGGGGRV